jgi:hypothetical protein
MEGGTDMAQENPPVNPFKLWFGLGFATIVWILHLSIVYAFQSVACHWGFLQFNILGVNALRLALIVFTILAAIGVVIGGWIAYKNYRSILETRGDKNVGEPTGRFLFMAQGGFMLASLFLLSILFSLVPLVILDACSPYWW